MKTEVTFELGEHRGKKVIFILFGYDKKLVEQVKKLVGASWSQSKKCWYVLDNKEHRDKFKKFAILNGYEIRLHFLDISKEIRWKRVKQRNNEKGVSYEFDVSQADFDFMETWFEKPNDDELKDGIIIRT